MADHPDARVVREVIEALSRNDVETVVANVAVDVVWHVIGNPVPILGRPALLEHLTEDGHPVTLTVSIHDIVSNDDHTIALVMTTATKAGRALPYRTTEIYHLADGLVTERWAFSDDTAAIKAFLEG